MPNLVAGEEYYFCTGRTYWFQYYYFKNVSTDEVVELSDLDPDMLYSFTLSRSINVDIKGVDYVASRVLLARKEKKRFERHRRFIWCFYPNTKLEYTLKPNPMHKLALGVKFCFTEMATLKAL